MLGFPQTICKKEEINCFKKYSYNIAFHFSKPSFSFTHKKVAKFFAKIQGLKRILSHIYLPANFFLNREKGRFSITQTCQTKNVFSSLFLNYLIHKVFFSTAKKKIKRKHRT